MTIEMEITEHKLNDESNLQLKDERKMTMEMTEQRKMGDYLTIIILFY